MIRFVDRFTVAKCRAHPDEVFVFGDNLAGHGTGGQAVIRHEPNVFGIPTKVRPGTDRNDYFNDDNPEHTNAVVLAMQ